MLGVVILGIVIVALSVSTVFFTLWNSGEKLPARLRRRSPEAADTADPASPAAAVRPPRT
jgi:hypothetical protein